jgi:nucleotide-binding universal stress UspA family protein
VSAAAIVGIVLATLVVGLAAGYALPPNGLRPARARSRPVRHILLPFTGQAISRRAFDAAVRLARAEQAVLMPAFLAQVPMQLPLDVPLPAQCTTGMPLLEAIEQLALRRGVEVDSRIARGRSYRDALRRLLADETFDRIVVSAGPDSNGGFGPDDLEWLLERVPAEVLILRPAPEDVRRISVAAAPRARRPAPPTGRSGVGKRPMGKPRRSGAFR